METGLEWLHLARQSMQLVRVGKPSAQDAYIVGGCDPIIAIIGRVRMRDLECFACIFQ